MRFVSILLHRIPASAGVNRKERTHDYADDGKRGAGRGLLKCVARRRARFDAVIGGGSLIIAPFEAKTWRYFHFEDCLPS